MSVAIDKIKMSRIERFNTAWLAITYKCNNKCVWCYASSNTDFSKRVMSLDDTKKAVGFLKEMGIEHVILIGGEPTVYKDLEEVVKDISDKGIRTGIVTNGRRLKDVKYLKRLKEAGLKYCAVSVEGHDQEVHDETTGIEGSFNETLRGLENAILQGVKATTNTTISRRNIKYLKETVDLLARFPLYLATFNICGVCLTSNENSQNTISPTEGVKAFEGIFRYAKSKGLKTKLVTPSPLCLFSPEILKEIREEDGATGPCHILPGKNFVLDYNGDVVPCTHFTGFPFFNIFKNVDIISREEFIERYNNPEGIAYKFRERD